MTAEGGGGGGSDLFLTVCLRKVHLFLADLESDGFLAPKIRRRKPISQVIGGERSEMSLV